MPPPAAPARGGEPVYALTPDEFEALRACFGGVQGRRVSKAERSKRKRDVILSVRKRTGWGLRICFLLVETVRRYRRAVTYDEIRVMSLRKHADAICGTGQALRHQLRRWAKGETTGDEAEDLEDVVLDLRYLEGVLLEEARELRFERGDEDPAEDQEHRLWEHEQAIFDDGPLMEGTPDGHDPV